MLSQWVKKMNAFWAMVVAVLGVGFIQLFGWGDESPHQVAYTMGALSLIGIGYFIWLIWHNRAKVKTYGFGRIMGQGLMFFVGDAMVLTVTAYAFWSGSSGAAFAFGLASTAGFLALSFAAKGWFFKLGLATLSAQEELNRRARPHLERLNQRLRHLCLPTIKTWTKQKETELDGITIRLEHTFGGSDLEVDITSGEGLLDLENHLAWLERIVYERYPDRAPEGWR